MEERINGWTRACKCIDFGPNSRKNNWMDGGGGRMFDGQMSTLTDGWFADVLDDRPGDDGEFVFVVLYGWESMRH